MAVMMSELTGETEHHSVLHSYLYTPSTPLRYPQHPLAEPLPPSQCYKRVVPLTDTHGSADFLGDDDPAEVIYAPNYAGCFHTNSSFVTGKYSIRSNFRHILRLGRDFL